MNKKTLKIVSIAIMAVIMTMSFASMVNATTYTDSASDAFAYPECKAFLTVETDPGTDRITVTQQSSKIMLIPVIGAARILMSWQVWDDKGYYRTGNSFPAEMPYTTRETWVHAKVTWVYLAPYFSGYTASAQCDVYVDW